MIQSSCFIRSALAAFISLLTFSATAQDYFQQEVDYEIRVQLNDRNHTLSGFEKIEYTNNSPDELEFIYFHIWPNAYRNNQTTLAREQFRDKGRHHLFKNQSQQGLIDSLNFKVNGRKVSWEYHPEHIDICKVQLNQPLESGETITITTPFRVKIPLGVTSRLGHIGQSYKITQWYPKPAVYDHRGWHPMPYRDMGEFYSEFGSFDVSITLPENYVVAASGQLQTQSELQWLNKRAVESEGRFSFDRSDMSIPASSGKNKTIRYTLENAHDFAWFADKRYHVMKDSVKLPNSGRHVTTWAYFTNDQAELWRNATNYINDAITYYSRWYGDYGYDNCSAILGAAGSRGNGMEYPTITAIGHTQQPKMLEQVIMHEVGHNWFYGMLGFNERRYPYLDEGINTFSEIRYIQDKYAGNNKLHQMLGIDEGLAGVLGADHVNYRYLHAISYLMLARQNVDQQTNLTSSEFNLANYAGITYSKTGLAFLHLMNYLGEDQFNTIMQEFLREWKFKHPYPSDLEKAFRTHTDKNLDWFFDGLMSTTGKIDYKMKKVKGTRLRVKNKGDIKAPLQITGFSNGEKTFSSWYKGFKGKQWLELPNAEADRYIIDPDKKMLELYRHNNTIRSKGIFRKAEPLKLQFFGLLNNPSFTQIHYLPSFGWNYYDNTMLGGLFYDAPFPPDRFDYYLAPMYSFGNKNLAGLGEVAWNMYPDKIFQQIQLRLTGRQFGYTEASNDLYNRIGTEAVFTFKKPDPRRKVINEIRYSATRATDINDILTGKDEPGHQYYHELTLLHDKMNRSINPYKLKAGMELSKKFIKTSLEAQYKISYYQTEGLNIRLFGGTFLHKEENIPSSYAFHLSGGSGLYDYTFENTFLGRFEDPGKDINNQFLSQQFYPDNGGFALYSPLGVTNDWLLSLNLSTSLPILRDIPIQLYGNAGAFGESIPVGADIANTDWAVETGVKFSFLSFLDIYFPVIASPNLEKTSNLVNERYGEKIRFHLKFDLFKPSEMYKRISL